MDSDAKRLEKNHSSNPFLIQMWTSVKQDHTLAMLRLSVSMFLAPILANVYQATPVMEKENVKVHISKFNKYKRLLYSSSQCI